MRSLLFGLFVFLFLYLFTPFRLNEREEDLFALCLGFGLITAISMIGLNIVVTAMFRRLFVEEKWTVGREILWTMVNIGVIGIGNAYYFNYWGGNFSIGTILLFTGFAMAVGIFPVSISVLINEAVKSKKYQKASVDINTQIQSQSKPTSPYTQQKTIVLPSQNAGEELSLYENQLLYIKASDNYSEVYFTDVTGEKKAILRNSLKAMEEAIGNNDKIIRCHKSYIVNLSKVASVTGNAQGYRLLLNEVKAEIPVSRQLNDSIKQMLLTAN